MPFKMITFDTEDEYLNNHPGSPPYYHDPCPSFSSSDSSPAVGFWSNCLGGISSGLVLPAAGQEFSSPDQVQVQQSRNRGRDGNNFLLKLIHRRLRNHSDRRDGGKPLQDSHDRQGTSREQENYRINCVNKLVLFDRCSRAFDLDDLLSDATAQVLGEGSNWTTYKVSLEDSTTVVVKRLKENRRVTMTEFREHMELIGQIRHENVAPLQGYYISRDKSLMLYDYFSQGSVYSMMHGEQRHFLSWEQRRKIVIGAARGIAYIHEQNDGKLFHGNLTSLNVFINTQGYGCVSEICCNILKSGESPYSCPNMREASQASDIYRLGLLMLELLTGQNPWMADAAREKPWMANAARAMLLSVCGYLIDNAYVFEHGLPHKECKTMLLLALRCVVDKAGEGPFPFRRQAEERPKIEELIEQVENIK